MDEKNQKAWRNFKEELLAELRAGKKKKSRPKKAASTAKSKPAKSTMDAMPQRIPSAISIRKKGKCFFRGVEVSSSDYKALKEAMALLIYGDDRKRLEKKKRAIAAYLKEVPADQEAKTIFNKLCVMLKAIEEAAARQKPSLELEAVREKSSAHPSKFSSSGGRPLQGGSPGLGKRK